MKILAIKQVGGSIVLLMQHPDKPPLEQAYGPYSLAAIEIDFGAAESLAGAMITLLDQNRFGTGTTGNILMRMLTATFEAGIHYGTNEGRVLAPQTQLAPEPTQVSSVLPECPRCGCRVVRNGTCFKCLNCGESLGCS